MVYILYYPLMQAKTRVKLNFLDNLAKFWELQVSVSMYVYVYAMNLSVTFASASIESLCVITVPLHS